MRSMMAIAALLAFSADEVAAAIPRNDGQIWIEADLTAQMTTTSSATLIATSRESSSLPNPTLVGGGFSVDSRLNRWTLGAGVYGVQIHSASERAATNIELPFLSATYSVKALGIVLSDRNRVEDLIGVPGAPYRYRNRVAADIPLRDGGAVTHLFVNDEVFYDFGKSRWSRNRAEIGFGVLLNSMGEVQIYYLRQDNYANLPRTVHVVGLTFKLGLGNVW